MKAARFASKKTFTVTTRLDRVQYRREPRQHLLQRDLAETKQFTPDCRQLHLYRPVRLLNISLRPRRFTHWCAAWTWDHMRRDPSDSPREKSLQVLRLRVQHRSPGHSRFHTLRGVSGPRRF